MPAHEPEATIPHLLLAARCPLSCPAEGLLPAAEEMAQATQPGDSQLSPTANNLPWSEGENV